MSAPYRCNHCGKTVERDSGKRWIKSYCEPSGRMTRLWRVTTPASPHPKETTMPEPTYVGRNGKTYSTATHEEVTTDDIDDHIQVAKRMNSHRHEPGTTCRCGHVEPTDGRRADA